MAYTHSQSDVNSATKRTTSIDYDLLNAGFKDCAREAIRFLEEEEHLSPDNPLVAGLKQYLEEQQRILAFQQIFLENNHIFANVENNRLNDSSTSGSIQAEGNNEESGISLTEETQQKGQIMDQSESHKHIDILQDLDIAAITSITEEILSLLAMEKDKIISDIAD